MPTISENMNVRGRVSADRCTTDAASLALTVALPVRGRSPTSLPKTAASTGSDHAKESRTFLSLPPEMRHEVYQHVVTMLLNDVVRPALSAPHRYDEAPHDEMKEACKGIVNLLQVSQSICHDFLQFAKSSVSLRENTANILPRAHGKTLPLTYGRIVPSILDLRHVSVDFNSMSSDNIRQISGRIKENPNAVDTVDISLSSIRLRKKPDKDQMVEFIKNHIFDNKKLMQKTNKIDANNILNLHLMQALIASLNQSGTKKLDLSYNTWIGNGFYADVLGSKLLEALKGSSVEDIRVVRASSEQAIGGRDGLHSILNDTKITKVTTDPIILDHDNLHPLASAATALDRGIKITEIDDNGWALQKQSYPLAVRDVVDDGRAGPAPKIYNRTFPWVLAATQPASVEPANR